MTKYGMVIDLKKCIGCYTCYLACRDEYVGNAWPPYSQAQPDMGHFWMKVIEKERGKCPKAWNTHIPMPCMHCDNPMCLKEAPAGAGYKRPDGIVIFDPVKSAGQRSMKKNCPYGVPYWNDELAIPQKCTFCVHLLERGWKKPRCVDSCPVTAISFGDLDDPASEVAKLVASGAAKQLHPEYNTKPNVFYINLDKHTKPFLAGSIYSNLNDDCVDGAIVTLKNEATGQVLDTTTNNYGDFAFEGLDKGKYTLRVELSGYNALLMENIAVDKDIYLGDVMLECCVSHLTK